MDNIKRENRLYLYPVRIDKLLGNYLAYELATWDPDEVEDDFVPFALEVIEQLLKECDLCISSCRYELIKEAKKGWLLPDRPAKFRNGGYADELIEYIKNNRPDWEYVVKEYAEKSGWFTFARKALYFSTSKADDDFVRKIETNFWGFKQVQISNKALSEIVDSCLSKPCYGIELIYSSQTHSMINIRLNPYYYPLQRFLEILNQVSQKHNYELEVKI